MNVKLDHVYVSVKDMDRAIKFYEDLLGMKVTHREENTWADFDIGHNFYFGLINPKIISDKRIVGNNAVPVFWSDDVDAVFEKVKKWKRKIVDEPTDLDFTDYPYRCFQFYDTEGNLLEVAKYDRE
ncbi:MAG TPA: VOC family protein [Candidatus Magasanikbacteria bacterium]|uniref:Glyoxalase family protein n=1 Tax=Candidatus Magasanikbacteria bacterium GW2011_GWA2_42_32 TaxID=1619039 RepID=A0A0G1A703_9BACT|nr:MAG: Glyoxalase family protein [Candidatus Magasanikbacteria bacterium GW2011_GWC2_40_17]KKS56729.1 MAG: Glyoxalase family protein [Candidatus Magasanikbacteria bacterium GW2011_GWA2_42_32]HBV58032.1 VOC family protein [Candidatus Magasanikbacteria bacterium]